MINKMFRNLINKKNTTEKNFLEYPAAQKKKMLKSAVEGANKRQLDLEKQYERTVLKSS